MPFGFGPGVWAIVEAMQKSMENEFFRHTGNIFIKRIYFDFVNGHREAIGHSHKHDHITLLAYGSMVVEVDGVKTTYHAPAFIDVAAGKHHRLTALEDKTVAYCVHDTHGLDIEDLGKSYL